MRLVFIILIPALLINLSAANKAFAYRPFVSTDAAVAGPKEFEFEIGYFNMARAEGQNTFFIPSAIINFGILHRLELVGEFKVEMPPDLESAEFSITVIQIFSGQQVLFTAKLKS